MSGVWAPTTTLLPAELIRGGASRNTASRKVRGFVHRKCVLLGLTSGVYDVDFGVGFFIEEEEEEFCVLL